MCDGCYATGIRILAKISNIRMITQGIIRPIHSKDNKTLARVLRRVLVFTYIDTPMGNTGHYSCPVWMTKLLL
jgi:hypothetical protein